MTLDERLEDEIISRKSTSDHLRLRIETLEGRAVIVDAQLKATMRPGRRPHARPRAVALGPAAEFNEEA